MTQTVDKVKSGIRSRGKHNSALDKICESNRTDYEQLWDEIFGYPEYRPTHLQLVNIIRNHAVNAKPRKEY